MTISHYSANNTDLLFNGCQSNLSVYFVKDAVGKGMN